MNASLFAAERIVVTKELSLPISIVAERLVAGQLSKKGHKILCQNYSGRGFELDIVSMQGKTLVLVEVKFRSNRKDWLDIDALIPTKKRQCLRRGIQSFIYQQNINNYETIRCDLALVCSNTSQIRTLKKPYNLETGIRLYYFEGISLEV